MEKQRYPTISYITEALNGHCDIVPVPIPLDCINGFQKAFYSRPEAFLEKEIRLSQSAWGFLSQDQEEKLVKALEDDLRYGEWDKKYGHFRTQPTFTCALRLIIARP